MAGTPLFKKSTQSTKTKLTTDEIIGEQKYWTILVADDEKHVHELTQLLLEDFRFENRPLNILNAYTGAEAKEYLRTHSDIALHCSMWLWNRMMPVSMLRATLVKN